MSFFDNAKEILIGDKEVALLKIGDKTVYEKSQPVPVTGNTHLTFVDGDNAPIPNFKFDLFEVSSSETTVIECDANGVANFDIDTSDKSAMTHYINVFNGGSTLFKIKYDSSADGWYIVDDYNDETVAQGTDFSNITATLVVPNI